MPVTRAAFEAGEITTDHVCLLATLLHSRLQQAFFDSDEQDLDTREVHLARSFNDSGILNGTLTPLGRNKLGTELDRLTDLLFKQDWKAATERLGEGNVSEALETADVCALHAGRSASSPRS